MAESPDYQPIEFAPYPPTPSSYLSVTNEFQPITTGTTAIQALNDGKLYLVKSFAAAVSVYVPIGSSQSTVTVRLIASRGINNANVAAGIFGNFYTQIPAPAASTNPQVVTFKIEAPSPIVVLAGSNVAPNNLSVVVNMSGGPPGVFIAASLLAWPLN